MYKEFRETKVKVSYLMYPSCGFALITEHSSYIFPSQACRLPPLNVAGVTDIIPILIHDPGAITILCMPMQKVLEGL